VSKQILKGLITKDGAVKLHKELVPHEKPLTRAEVEKALMSQTKTLK
jgi:hypothetical protein